ncbi:hypothetical protein [Fodinibius saliphilus]|uniref:hypothetical protein n=1 Tax=Fodinibius saliphilus TaxID=1920650 RepID=UPI001108BDA9|nr:hypothetical protein [Fodinibius saliphilus]
MFILSIRKIVSIVCLTLFTSSVLYSQSYEFNDYRRLSLTFSGGASLGDRNNSSTILSSNFTTNTDVTPAFDAGVQYALTPAWSLELGYRRTQIVGSIKQFETNMNMVTLKNIINLNQVLLLNRASTRINPYLTAGVGYDMFKYKGPDGQFYDHDTSYNAGFGIAYKVNNLIDVFTHYEYRLGANSMDNEMEGWGSDLLNSLTGGVRLHLGKKKSSRHLSWRPSPVDLSPADYNQFITQNNRIESLNRRLTQAEDANKETERYYKKLIENNTVEIDSLKSQIALLKDSIEELRKALGSMQSEIRKVEVNRETGVAYALPQGHYTQIFATYFLETAQKVRNNALKKLGEDTQAEKSKILIIKRKQFYEVLIGVFNDYENSKRVQEIMNKVHDDAYVISFPRPVNLKQDFEGLRVVNEN